MITTLGHIIKSKLSVLLAALLLAAASCTKIDNKSTPNYPVRINLGSYAMWATYGVNGLGEYKLFCRTKQLPSNFPYNANTYTGFGGVILIYGLDISTSTYGPIAFEAACPVENKPTVLLDIDPDNFDAVCPNCKSRYNVIGGAGGPISGQAVEKKKGLRSFIVRQSVNGGYIITSY